MLKPTPILMLIACLVFGSLAASEALSAPSLTEDSGLAAVYSDKLAGHLTASGKKYDPAKLTAAHKSLPFGTHVKVTNSNNGKSVELEITDRGPTQKGRIVDLSPAAARALGIHKYAMAPVKLEIISN